MDTVNSLKTLKCRNRKKVLTFLRTAGAVSVNVISKSTGLSKMTVHKIIDHYLGQNIIALAGKGASTEDGGKKPNLFAFNPNHAFIFVVRLGNFFVNAAVANLNGEPLALSGRVPHDGTCFADVLDIARREFEKLTHEAGLPQSSCLAAVIGSNGIVDVENGLCLANYEYPHWGPVLRAREGFESVMPPEVPVYIDSWWRHIAGGVVAANGAMFGRTFFLIGNSDDRVAGGLVIDGRVCQGATGFAGEVGHLVVDSEGGEPCICGGRGCLEAMVAPSRIIARAEELRARYPGSAVFDGGRAPTFEEIAAASNNADPLARELMDEAAKYFAIAFNNLLHACDPGAFVLFGDYSTAGGFFLNRLRERAANLSLSSVDKRIRIDCSPLDDYAGVLGAVHFAVTHYFNPDV